jgi:hypothetical protein
MLFQLILRYVLTNSKSDKIVLGRWGYHWENNIKYQKYYE